MLDWIKSIKSWGEFSRIILILVPTTVITGTAMFGGFKAYFNRQLDENIEDVRIDKTLTELKQGQDSLAFRLDQWQSTFNGYKSKEEGKMYSLTHSVNRVERNLDYYVKHSGDMTIQQILEAFELGKEAGVLEQKKKTVYDSNGSGKPIETLDQIFSSYQ